MTEDRARPIVAFVLVSLLCAFILSLNMAGQERVATATEHAAQVVPAASEVIFGDTLKPRPLGQTGLGGLGSLTLNDAAAGKVVVPPARTTPRTPARHRATAAVRSTPVRHPVRPHVVVRTPVVSTQGNGRHLGWTKARRGNNGNGNNGNHNGSRANNGNHGNHGNGGNNGHRGGQNGQG